MQSAALSGSVTLGIRKQRKPSSSQYSRESHEDSSVIQVKLIKEENEGFGFVIMTSQLPVPGPHNNNNLNKSHVHTIGNIVPDSPADKCGQLKLKDRIVSVNGKNLMSLTHTDVVNIIKMAKHSVILGVISYLTSETNSLNLNHNYTQPVLGQKFSIIIEQNLTDNSFGFGLRGGQEYGMSLYILRLRDNGPAAICFPKIDVGDKLIAINDIPCHGNQLMSHKNAIDLIRRGGKSLRLTLEKGNGTVPELGQQG